jgi:hypothetical protein
MADDDRMEALRAELADTRALATVGVKAAISALAGLESLLQGIRHGSMRGAGRVPEDSVRLAEEHVERGLAILREAIEGPDRDG